MDRFDIIQKEAEARLEEINEKHLYNERRLEEAASDIILKARKKLEYLLEEFDQELNSRRARLREELEEVEAATRRLEELRNGY